MISFLAVSSGTEEFRASLPVVSLICICRTSGSVPTVSFIPPLGWHLYSLYNSALRSQSLCCDALALRPSTTHHAVEGGNFQGQSIYWFVTMLPSIHMSHQMTLVDSLSVERDHSWWCYWDTVTWRKITQKYYVLHMHADIKQQPRTDWCERLYHGNWTGQGNVHMCTNVSSLFLIKRLETQSTQKTRKQNRKTCFIVNFVVVGYIRQVLHFVTMAIARIKFRNPVGRSIWL